MTSLPGGGSASAELRRWVMVVEEDPERSRRLCALLTRHGLTARPVHVIDLAMEAQGWPGAILVGDGAPHPNGWALAERIRTFDARVPIILLGTDGTTNPPQQAPQIQAYLPHDTTEDRLCAELERWMQIHTPPATREAVGEVLLVDDDERLRGILQNVLELKGFTVLTASSGEEALASLRHSSPRIVLLDLKMPGMDGLTTLKRLRISHPSLPVIIISHLDEEPLIEEAGILGAHDYLVKPFNFDHLESVLLAAILESSGGC